MRKQDIITRRKFFKQSASVILPTLAAIAIPSVLTSCEIDDVLPEEPSGCKNGCSGKCSGYCGAACQADCDTKCISSCTSKCSGGCGSSCRGLCTGSSKYGY